jgi:hypothetical protein
VLNIPTLQEQLFPGGSFAGGPSGGPINMSAAREGEYIFDDSNPWHARMSIHMYMWLIIVGAAALLVLSGTRVAFGPVNV